MGTTTHHPPTPALRAAAPYLLALLAPPLAWLVWISPAAGSASDARSVLWFATVALGALLAGVLAPSRRAHLVAVGAAGVLAAMTVLSAWWSSEDTSGLYVIGLVLALPLLVAGAAACLAVGRAIGMRVGLR